MKHQKSDGRPGKKRDVKTTLYEWIEALVTAVVVVVVLFSTVFRIVGVDGTSMLPNLEPGDRILLTGIYTNPQYGDVVVITHTNSVEGPIVKRVIATENQTVDIDMKTGVVSVNGTPLDESRYIQNGMTNQQSDLTFPLTVPEGHVFVLGDNRPVSKDSRSAEIGLIDQKYIMGKAQLVLYPFNHIGGIKV